MALKTFPLIPTLLLLCLPFFGCDEGGSDPEPEVVTPFELSRATSGLGFFAGEHDVLTQSGGVEEIESTFSTAIIRAQLLDELKVSREGTGAVSDAMFSSQVAERMDALRSVADFDRYVVVLDVMRVSDGNRPGSPEPYLTTWDSNTRDTSRYGFWRGEYRDVLLEEIEAVATAQKPDVFIIGAEIEAYLSMSGGASDFANLLTLYRDAYQVIKTTSPETLVGLGVDWVRFQLDIVPLQTLTAADLPKGFELEEGETEIACSALPEEERAVLERICTDKAFRSYIEPALHHIAPGLVEEEATYVRTADILALSAQPSQNDFGNVPGTCPDDLFGYLRSWSQEFPAFYYQVNWRISSAVGFAKQDEWLRTLIERNAGVNIELVAWPALRDLLESDCGKLTNDLGAPDSVCFGGLWKDSTAPKAVLATFQQLQDSAE